MPEYTCTSCGFATALCVCSAGPRDPETDRRHSAAHTELRELRVLLASKNHCSAELHKVGTKVVDALDRALAQACTNLATIRPSGRDTSLYEDALAWRQALLDGLGSPW